MNRAVGWRRGAQAHQRMKVSVGPMLRGNVDDALTSTRSRQALAPNTMLRAAIPSRSRPRSTKCVAEFAGSTEGSHEWRMARRISIRVCVENTPTTEITAGLGRGDMRSHQRWARARSITAKESLLVIATSTDSARTVRMHAPETAQPPRNTTCARQHMIGGRLASDSPPKLFAAGAVRIPYISWRDVQARRSGVQVASVNPLTTQ